MKSVIINVKKVKRDSRLNHLRHKNILKFLRHPSLTVKTLDNGTVKEKPNIIDIPLNPCLNI